MSSVAVMGRWRNMLSLIVYRTFMCCYVQHDGDG